MQQTGHNVGRRMVVARLNCSRMGVERRSNRSRIVVVTTALPDSVYGLHGCAVTELIWVILRDPIHQSTDPRPTRPTRPITVVGCTVCIQIRLRRTTRTHKTRKKRSEETQTGKHCALAVVRRSQKNFAPPQTTFPGARDGQNLISWRRSLPLSTNPV